MMTLMMTVKTTMKQHQQQQQQQDLITSGKSNLITGRIVAAHGRLNGICQVVPV